VQEDLFQLGFRLTNLLSQLGDCSDGDNLAIVHNPDAIA
jgi:hypothetical protein